MDRPVGLRYVTTENYGDGNGPTFVQDFDRNRNVRVYILHEVKKIMSLDDSEVDGILVLSSDDEMDLDEEAIEAKPRGEEAHGIPLVQSKEKSQELVEEAKMLANNLLICSLCLGEIAGKTPVCSHIFCENCFLGAVFEQAKCPICETEIASE